jgi:hypothetical protein
MTDKLLSTSDVAASAGVTGVYIHQLVARGVLPPPVIPGRRGGANTSAMWRASEIKPALARLRKLPWGAKSPNGVKGKVITARAKAAEARP